MAGNYIIPLGIPASKISWIPNGVELDGYPRPSPASAGAKFKLMYFGAHGQANGLDCLLRAMAVLETRSDCGHVELELIGDGPMKGALQREARRLNLRRVSFLEPVAKDEIPGIAAQADAFIFNLIAAPVFKYGISSNKLYDFMAAARPIIFCCESANNPVADASAGFTTPPGDHQKLALAIAELASLPLSQRNAMGLSARKYVEEQHSLSQLGSKLAMVLDSVTNNCAAV